MLSLVSLAAVEAAPGSDGNDTDAEADDVDTPPLPRDAGMSVTRRARGIAGRCYGRRDAVAAVVPVAFVSSLRVGSWVRGV